MKSEALKQHHLALAELTKERQQRVDDAISGWKRESIRGWWAIATIEVESAAAVNRLRRSFRDEDALLTNGQPVIILGGTKMALPGTIAITLRVNLLECPTERTRRLITRLGLNRQSQNRSCNCSQCNRWIMVTPATDHVIRIGHDWISKKIIARALGLDQDTVNDLKVFYESLVEWRPAIAIPGNMSGQ